jgi:elongation factor G
MATLAPPALIEMAIEPRYATALPALLEAASQLAPDYPGFGVATDAESGQTILKGTSEAQLNAICDRLEETAFFNRGAPQVAFRETITRDVTKDYTHKRHTGGTGQFAWVRIVVEPAPSSDSFEFAAEADGTIPGRYLPGIVTGLLSVLSAGVVAGLPVVGIKITLIDGAYHEIDSSPLAFEIAARAALREALQEAGSVLLEPIMTIEILTPGEFTAAILRDLNTRRATVEPRGERDGHAVISGDAPLRQLLGYDRTLADISGGRATWSMQFDRYSPVPSHFDDDEPPLATAMALRA